MLKIIEKTKIWFGLSFLVFAIAIGFIAFRGLNVGIDFKGGTQVVIEFGKEFDKAEVDTIVNKYAEGVVTNTLEKTQIEIRAKELDSTKVSELVNELKEKYKEDKIELLTEDTIGASVGNELTKNSLIALAVAILGILVYVSFRFELDYAVASIIALLHDVLITISVYAIFNVPMNTPFIAAILTIIGYSINDTIVIFDRIRENNKHFRSMDNAEIANRSITQTLARSINTTLTTLITILAVYILVPSVREFAFPLTIGIATGAYSSIFIASPVWVMFRKRKKKKI